MKLLFIHNDYYRPSGEEHSVKSLENLLREHNHEIIWYRRGSYELKDTFIGNSRAFFLSLYNPKAVEDIKRILIEQKPDLVQVQNLYPMISPRVLKAIKSQGVPVVMRCPNYRIFCPNGLFYDRFGNICEKCTGPGHELWCMRKNCMGNLGKSFAYALRNYFARITDVFRKYVDIFIVQSEFQRNKFIKLGLDANKIFILPSIAPDISMNTDNIHGKYVSFIGRVSLEKGIDDFISAAIKMPEVPFVIAGKIREGVRFKNVPKNIEWRGFLKGKELEELFLQSAVLVVPSKWYEGFPNVITRAMYYSKPVITTDLGCFPEIIENGVNGYMYHSGDIDALVAHIHRILSNPSEAKQMGKAGREKAEREYSRDVIYKKLMNIYDKAIYSAK